MRVVFVCRRLKRQTHRVASPAKIRVCYADNPQQTVPRAVARANAKCAGALFLDVYLHDNRIRLNPAQHFDVDIFKKAKIVHALHRTPSFLRVENFANFLPHFAQDNVVLGFSVALDLVALQCPFVYAQVKDARLVDVHIRNFHQNVAVAAIFFLYRRQIVVQNVLVQNRVAAHGDKFLQIFFAVNRVAGNLDAAEHGIFKQVIRQNNSFGNFFNGLVGVVEIADIDEGVAVANRSIRVEPVADVRKNSCANRWHCRFAGALKLHVDDNFAVKPLQIIPNHVVSPSFRTGKIRHRNVSRRRR